MPRKKAPRLPRGTEKLLSAEVLLHALSVAKEEAGFTFRWPVLDPHHEYYLRWCLGVTLWAMLMAVIDPLNLAFAPATGFYPYDDFWAVIEYLTIMIFATDMVLKFFVAYDDEEIGRVTEHKLIALRYFRLLFWVDFLTTLPIDSIAIAGVGLDGNQNEQQRLYLSLIRWIKLARLYRVVQALDYLNKRMFLGQIGIIILRTILIMFYVAHWMGCVLYFVARAEGFSENSWLGAYEHVFESDTWERYFYSLFFSFVIYTGFGDNDLYSRNALETCIVCAYLAASILLQAYMLGSITTVMVSDDERSNEYRERVECLALFSKQKNLPEGLSDVMREHLELLHHTEITSDNLILRCYPSALRKKVLRHLYMDIFKKCYLFWGCKSRFLDEVISMARMEVFNPHMEVLAEGEVVQELFIVVEGVVHGAMSESSASKDRKTAKQRAKSGNLHDLHLMANEGSGQLDSEHSFSSKQQEGSGEHGKLTPSASAKSGASASFGGSTFGVSFRSDGGSAMHSFGQTPDTLAKKGAIGSSRGVGHCFGEFSFFTESPCLQNYWTGCLTRIMILSRSQIDELTEKHPKQVKAWFHNLRLRTEEKFRQVVSAALTTVEDEAGLGDGPFSSAGQPTDEKGDNEAGGAMKLLSNEHTDHLQATLSGLHSFSSPSLKQPLELLKWSLPTDQRCNLEYWHNARTIVVEYLKEKEHQNVYAIIAAAADADIAAVKRLVAWGVPPGATNYDKRTALMVAAKHNNTAIVKYLLEAGAPPSDQDAFGSTALHEAVRMGHGEVIDLLIAYHAKLGMDEAKTAHVITEAVVAGDLIQLKWLLRIGAKATWGDYDRRTPLHIAAAEGNLSAVEVLIEEGNACVDALDRFGRTPSDFARRAGNVAIADYLNGLMVQGKHMSWTESKWYSYLRGKNCISSVGGEHMSRQRQVLVC